MAILEVKNIHKRFGETEVLKGIDFSLNKGNVLTIIGSSGSGKTTLLRCLNFLETADLGEIIVNEETLFKASSLNRREREKSLRKKRLHFGLVFQNFNLFPQYSALKNVTLAMDLKIKEDHPKIKKREFVLLKNKNKESAKNILADVGLADKMENYPSQLSGGQQQRVAIARALALNPDILCFDEPTSALDPELTDEVLKVIQKLKSSDRTMVIVTHEMQFAHDVSDYILFMADGVVEEMGTPAEIFENPQKIKTQNFVRKFMENKNN